MSKGGVGLCFVLSLIGLIFWLPNPKQSNYQPCICACFGSSLNESLSSFGPHRTDPTMLPQQLQVNALSPMPPSQPDPFFLYYKVHGFGLYYIKWN